MFFLSNDLFPFLLPSSLLISVLLRIPLSKEPLFLNSEFSNVKNVRLIPKHYYYMCSLFKHHLDSYITSSYLQIGENEMYYKVWC